MKITMKVQLEPAVTLLPHVLVWARSLESACVSWLTFAELLGTTCSAGTAQLSLSLSRTYEYVNIYPPLTASDLTPDFAQGS
jgi:hypothetical protein